MTSSIETLEKKEINRVPLLCRWGCHKFALVRVTYGRNACVQHEACQRKGCALTRTMVVEYDD